LPAITRACYWTVTCKVTLWLTACAPVPPLAVTVTTKEFVEELPVPVEVLPTWLHPLIPPSRTPNKMSTATRQERFFRGQMKSAAHAKPAPASEPVMRCARSWKKPREAV